MRNPSTSQKKALHSMMIGYYWSSTQNTPASAWSLSFNSSIGVNAGNSSINRANGFSVRCVAD